MFRLPARQSNLDLGSWRILAIGLALTTGAVHLLLAVVNLIPGEPTMGLVFAAMGLGFVLVAGLILRRNRLLDQLSALYTVGLILVYVVSRLRVDTPLTFEPIGLTTKAVEALLLGVLIVLVLRPSEAAA